MLRRIFQHDATGLILLDFYLWGKLKNIIYHIRTQGDAKIDCSMCITSCKTGMENVNKLFKRRLIIYCIISNGHHFE